MAQGSISVRIRMLGVEHTKTLDSVNNLAMVLQS
jgi:hypothetical protein